MTKRKYRILLDCVIIFLCLFPLIALMFTMRANPATMTSEEIINFVSAFSISETLTNTITTALENAHLNVNGVFGTCASVILSNTLMIHILFVFVSVLCFVPKMAIKLLNLTTGGKYE